MKIWATWFSLIKIPNKSIIHGPIYTNIYFFPYFNGCFDGNESLESKDFETSALTSFFLLIICGLFSFYTKPLICCISISVPFNNNPL